VLVLSDSALFKEQLMRGVTSVVYPLLSWLLSRMEDLRKRAYLARYLRNIDVPEEMFADAGNINHSLRFVNLIMMASLGTMLLGLVTLFQKHKEAQTEFKEMHKQVQSTIPSYFNYEGITE
jgi:hypothetical protein